MITKDYSPIDGDVMPKEDNWYYEVCNDVQADNAIRFIKEETKNTERIIAIAQAEKAALDVKIRQLRERCEQRTQEKRDALQRYFETVEHRQTKTTEKYDLLSGTLTRKKATKAPAVEDVDVLTRWLEENQLENLVQTTKKPKWGELKKLIDYDAHGNVTIRATGEVVEGVTVEEKPESFKIDF